MSAEEHGTRREHRGAHLARPGVHDPIEECCLGIRDLKIVALVDLHGRRLAAKVHRRGLTLPHLDGLGEKTAKR